MDEILALLREIAAMLRSPLVPRAASRKVPRQRHDNVIDLMEALKRSLERHRKAGA